MVSETVDGGNPLREAWREGQGQAGGWCEIPSAFSAQIVAQSGFDWVCVDWQHGLAGFETLAAMVQAISVNGTVPLVRVPFNQGWLIQKALDVGAFGVIVPLVNNATEAAEAASACRYAPRGRRSFSPIRTAPVLGPDPVRSDAQVVCIAMIETREGLEALEAICSTPGIDGLFIGPDDLALSLELELGSAALAPVLESILETGRRHGIPVGRHCGSGEAAAQAIDAGFLFAAVASDRDFLGNAAAIEARAARDGASPAFGHRPDRVNQVVLSAAHTTSNP